jgi:holo-[acyl-carrier protein] synthase
MLAGFYCVFTTTREAHGCLRYDPLMRIIAHGIDAVEVSRIESLLEEHGERFVDRCFSDVERAYADSGPTMRAQRYAARFACKEAVMKALGTGWTGGVSWRDIEVVREPTGQPRLRLSGRCAELAASLNISHWHLSITHTPTLALASVMATDAAAV